MAAAPLPPQQQQQQQKPQQKQPAPLPKQPPKKDTEYELLVKDNQELELLGQGTYGCAFYPEINCKTHHIHPATSRKYLSKIQYEDESLKRELKIGARIAKMFPNYRYYYAPIVESCPVQLSELKQNKIKQCQVLTKYSGNKKRIVSSKIPFVGKSTLNKYFNSLFQLKKNHCKIDSRHHHCRTATVTYLKKLVNTYLYLIGSFQKLNADIGVVHLDVKGDNIMYDTKNDMPILIDFGLSFCIEWLQLPKYLEFPYAFGVQSFSYSPWCIEVSLLTYLARQVRRPDSSYRNAHGGYLDEQLFTKTPISEEWLQTYQAYCRDFVKSNLKKEDTFSDAERQKLTTDLQTWITNLARKSKTLDALWTALLQTYKTWDLYAVAMMYLDEMIDTGLTTTSSSTTNTAEPIREFTLQLKRMILSVPTDRPGPQKLIQDARAIFSKMSKSNYDQVSAAANPLVKNNNIIAEHKAKRAVQMETPLIMG